MNLNDSKSQEFLLGGCMLALLVLLGLGLGLLAASRWPACVARCARAGRTASLVFGAGVALVSLAAVAFLVPTGRAPALGYFWICALVPLFVLGFAADALRTGRRLTGGEGAGHVAIGWLVRAGALAVPFVWPVVGAYLLISALGNPVAALVAGKATTAPSPGSSAER